MYNTKFILPFNNELSEFYEIYFDFLNYVGNSQELVGSDATLTIRSTGGDENKMEPILGTEALIDIWITKDQPITIADLIAEHDNDIRVTVYREKDYNTCVFQGFIVVEDNSQPFLDPPFTLSVRALDGLGLLKGVDLVDTNNLKFAGPYSVLSWIAQILYKTGQTLPIRIFFNWFNVAFNPVLNPLEQTFLNSITFSQGDAFNVQPNDPSVDINALTADDCYTALEKIVRCFRCRLFQEDGCWNLVNLNEYSNPSGYSYTQYTIGDPVSGIVPITAVLTAKDKTFDTPIGKEEIIFPVQEDQILYLKLATKSVKLTYTYDQSQNKVCNQDLSDTTEADRDVAHDEMIQSQIIDPTFNPSDPTLLLQTQAYSPFCFTQNNGTYPAAHEIAPYPPSSPTSTAFIRTVLDKFGYEVNRFLVMPTPGDNTFTYLRTNKFLIDEADILQINFSWRTRTAAAANTHWPLAFAFLYGDDGTFWGLRNAIGIVGGFGRIPIEWVQTDSNFIQIGSTGAPPLASESIPNSNTWNAISINTNDTAAEPIAKTPVSGTIEILLAFPQFSQTATEYWFKDIDINILSYLQGSYRQLKGDFNYCSSNNNIKQTDAEDVEISDSPKRYFKGALVTGTGSVLLAPSWARPGISETLRFTQAMEGIVFTHLSRILRKVEGTFKGLIYRTSDYQERPSGYLGSYSFSDSENKDKKYMLTSFEKNYGTGTWRGVFVETLKDANDPGFIRPDSSINYDFSYIFQ